MSLNESLTQAYDTISEYACFDTFTNVPHPENLKFQADVERRAMHRLGLKLLEIVSDPDGEDAQYAARTLHRHFLQELGLSQPPDLATEIPRFLLKPDQKMKPRIDLQALIQQLAAVAMSESPVICIVASNLALLQKLLNLSDTVIKFLKIAFVNCSIHSLDKDEASGIRMALSYIGLRDDAHRNRAVAALLNESLAAVDALFATPSALVALRFVDAAVFNQKRSLRDVFALTDEFVTLLETPYRSDNALLAAILEPEQDFLLYDDGSTPMGYLYEIMPNQIAECYERTVLNRPLQYQHVHQIMEWFTGGLTFPHESVYALEGRITFETIREALKRAALECSQANKLLDAHALLKVIYGASN